MTHPTFQPLQKILPAIAARATLLDRTGGFPFDDLRDLASIGADRWFVPTPFGGEEIDPLELHLRYEAIASASLATALVVSQRDSAVGLIDAADSSPLREEILPALARGEYLATIGIAQLTTSRQTGPPALRAREQNTGFLLDGIIPWSTAAAQSKFVVAGAVTHDNQQILFVLPNDLSGISIEPPMPLVALRSSWTAQIDLNAVHLDPRWILRGPAPKALAGKSRGIPIAQAFLAFGLCRGGLQLISAHRSDRAQSLLPRFTEQLTSLRTEVLELCRPDRQPDATAATPRLRAACNDLATRITQSAVALYKGSALHLDHPAQRLAREALFLLVWSCPDPVIDCTVNTLAQR